MKEKINTRVLKDSNLIVQGNKLINARYKLSTQESRLLYAAMSLIKPEDEDFKKYKINVSDLSKYLGLFGGNIYTSLRKVTHSLIAKSIVMEDEDGWKEFPLLTFAEYEKSDNSITLQFHPEMRPFLLQQKQSFTQAKLQNLIKYGSSYTPRIYLFLREYINLSSKRRDILVEDLKNKLELDNYEYNDLKRRVLLPAKSEMEYHSDIRFELIEHKQNKKVYKITFLIYQNTPSNALEISEEIPAEVINQQDEIEKSFAKILFKKYDVSKNVGLELAKEHANFAPTILNYIDHQITRNSAIKNIGGYAVNTIRNKEYEFYDDKSDDFKSFVQCKKLLSFDLLAKEKQQEIIENNQNDLQKALAEMIVPDCKDDYLLYVLAIKDRDIEKRAKSIRKKIEETINSVAEQENQEIWDKLQGLFLDNFGKEIWEKWLSCLELYSKSDNEIIFSVPRKFNRDWIKREFLNSSQTQKGLKDLVNQIFPDIQTVSIICVEKETDA